MSSGCRCTNMSSTDVSVEIVSTSTESCEPGKFVTLTVYTVEFIL